MRCKTSSARVSSSTTAWARPGNIAVDAVARSAPDGSVLAGAIAAPIVTNPMFMKLNIDPMKELTPVTMLGTTPSVVIASKKSGARTLPDFIAMLKRDPGKYSFSSVGIGTTGHLSAELIALKSGTKMVHVSLQEHAGGHAGRHHRRGGHHEEHR